MVVHAHDIQMKNKHIYQLHLSKKRDKIIAFFKLNMTQKKSVDMLHLDISSLLLFSKLISAYYGCIIFLPDTI